MFVLENTVQKRWKVVREKFSVAYRKYYFDGTASSWALYDMCMFLAPFVNLKNDSKKDDEQIESSSPPLLIERQAPSKSPFDENELTHLVKDRPVLYDKHHEDFRSSSLRKLAWKEISQISGWDVGLLQRRWRVMRDRFVRELRRTKNIENESHVNCSAFFRDMLFLVRHVNSKKYAVEATEESLEVSHESWDHGSTGDDSQLQGDDQLETCMVQDMDSSNAENVQVLEEEAAAQMEVFEIDENPDYSECFEERNDAEQIFDENSNQEEFFTEEEEVVASVDDQQEEHDVVAVQDIPAEQWFLKRRAEDLIESPKKRMLSYDTIASSAIKSRQSESPARSASEYSHHRTRDLSESTTDEDVVFGQMVGCMLKKIPAYLKTSIKLKLLQSIEDFEIHHKLK